MFTDSTLLFLHAETSVHLGSGQSGGAVDLAVQRERHTDFPVGAASSLKGAVRSWFRAHDDSGRDDQRYAAFGPDTAHASDHAGAVAFTDARLLLFPVRAMKGVFAWTTCPTILNRLRRDLDAAGRDVSWTVPEPGDDQALATEHNVNESGNEILLEENYFSYRSSDAVQEIAAWLRESALPATEAYAYWRESADQRLLVLHDDAFRDFVRHTTEVQARIKLNEDGTTGEGGNLFYQENLPCDTLFYALVLAQDDLSGRLDGSGSASDLLDYVRRLHGRRLQIGGDASVGRGRTYVHFLDAPATTNAPS